MVPIYQVLDHPTDIRGRPPACIPMLLCTQISVHTDLRYATAAGLEYDEGVRVHRGERKGMGIEICIEDTNAIETDEKNTPGAFDTTSR